MARYIYLQPLIACPNCGKDLTISGGILLELVIAGKTVETRTWLDGEGRLQDTEDKAVENGYHSETRCGHCGESLLHREHADDTFTNPWPPRPSKSLEITERPGHPDD